jgi:esterase/lipase superfamily enzyme
MEGKSGGAIAIGAVAAAVTCVSLTWNPLADTRQPLDSSSLATTQALDSKQLQAGRRSDSAFERVQVFYATDRAQRESIRGSGLQQLPWIGTTAFLGMLCFAIWFRCNGRRRLALVAGALSVVVPAASWIVLSSLGDGTRGITESVAGGCNYGWERGELELGTCEVSIPATHRTGEIEKPSILRLEFSARPDRHVMLQRITPQEHEEYFAALRQRVRASESRDLFVFVHGYNVTFEQAARRTAQMAYDLDYQGAPILYSWPSQGKPWKYTVDETNVTWSVPHLKRFLTHLAQESEAEAINLVAHSMGSRALTQALCELSYEWKQEGKVFNQVILAAPDIDADVFREQIAPALARQAKQVTLYASSSDEALAASKLVHGSRRAGESAARPLVSEGIETVDVAMYELGSLGHSYYGNSPVILQDLAAILRDALPAARRPWLTEIGDEGSRYWQLSQEHPTSARGTQRTAQPH